MRRFPGLWFVLVCLFGGMMVGAPRNGYTRENGEAEQAVVRWNTALSGRTEIPSISALPHNRTDSIAPQNVVVRPGAMVVWQSTASNLWDLNYARPDGVVQALVRTDDRSETNPTVRPGTTTVVYSAYNNENEADLYLVAPEAPTPIQLTTAPGIDTFASWSPDGNYIYFVSTRDGNGELYRMNADGTEQTRLTQNNYTDTGVKISPDGREAAWMVIVSDREGVVMIMDLATGAVRQATPPILFLSNLTWTSSGDRLFFTCDENENFWFDICSMNRDGTNLRMILDAPRYSDYYPSSSVPGDDNILLHTYTYGVQNNQLVLLDIEARILITSANNVQPFIPGTGTFDANVDYGKTELQPPKTTPPPFPRLIEDFSLESVLRYNYTATDNEAGISYGRVWRRINGGAWQLLADRVVNNSYYGAPFSGRVVGDTVELSFTSVDGVGNTEAIQPHNTKTVTIYDFDLPSHTFDNRGTPLPSAEIISADVISQTVRDPAGMSLAYMRGGTSIQFGASGYLLSSLFPTGFTRDYNRVVNHAFLDSPAINPNPGFEQGMTGYEISGGTLTTLDGQVHSGAQALLFQSAGELTFDVTLPASMNQPTLSFFHYSDSVRDDVIIEVTDTTTTTVVYTAPNEQYQYQHGWVDLSSWQDQTITIRVIADGAISVDDITIAEWNTPLITALTPAILPLPYSTTVLTAMGENFIEPVSVTIGDITVDTTVVSTQTLEISLPTGLEAGRYPVVIRNGAGLSTQAPVQIGTPAFLPLMRRTP